MSDKLRAAAKAFMEMQNINPSCADFYHGTKEFHKFSEPCKPLEKYMKVVDALRAALAEPAIKESLTVAELHPFEDASVISALSWAATLIEKEYPVKHNGAESWLMNYSDKHGEHIRRSDHREWEKVHGRWKPKAAPPRREWIGLTDADFEKEKFVDYNFMSGASFAESKLKEKNGG